MNKTLEVTDPLDQSPASRRPRHVTKSNLPDGWAGMTMTLCGRMEYTMGLMPLNIPVSDLCPACLKAMEAMIR